MGWVIALILGGYAMDGFDKHPWPSVVCFAIAAAAVVWENTDFHKCTCTTEEVEVLSTEGAQKFRDLAQEIRDGCQETMPMPLQRTFARYANRLDQIVTEETSDED